MNIYKYTALSKDGEKVQGIIEGFDEFDAVSKVKRSYGVIVNIKEVKDTPINKLLNYDIGGKKVNDKAFTMMCSQFAIILAAGMPIGRTVSLIAEKTTDKRLKKIMMKAAEDVDGGRTLSSSFEDASQGTFPQTFIETIRAGEQSGKLDESFDTIYKHYDKDLKMRAKVKNALIYPAFVMVVAIVVVAVLMIVVVPTFENIFASYGEELPGVTKALIAISNFFAKYWMLMVGVALGLYILKNLYATKENGKMNLAKLQLKLPVLGEIAVLNGASQFANNMASLLSSGLPLTRALQITSRALENYYISTEVGKLSAKLEAGKSLSDAIRRMDALPDILKDMMTVGEQTGELEKTLGIIGKFYDAELETKIDAAMKKLEPTILVFVAGVAGFIVIAMYMAMFGMYAAM